MYCQQDTILTHTISKEDIFIAELDIQCNLASPT